MEAKKFENVHSSIEKDMKKCIFKSVISPKHEPSGQCNCRNIVYPWACNKNTNQNFNIAVVKNKLKTKTRIIFKTHKEILSIKNR